MRNALTTTLVLTGALAVAACSGGARSSAVPETPQAPSGMSASNAPQDKGYVTPLGARAGATPVSCLPGAPAAPKNPDRFGGGKWIGAWGATLGTPLGGTSSAPSNATVRDIAKISLGGSGVRIRLSNATGSTPMVICAASIALQQGTSGAALVHGTTRQITFGGAPGITLAAGTAYVYSDMIPFSVAAQQNVAVSLYMSTGAEPLVTTPTWNTNYLTAANAGDQTRDESGTPFTSNFSSATASATNGFFQGGAGYALTGIDVLTQDADGAVVAFGSSTLHGYESDYDKYDRVADLISARITSEIAAGRQKGMVNEGIGGDSLYVGLARLQRDVWSQTGVKALVLYDINDLSNGRTVAQVEGDYRTVANQAHARGIKLYCPTWAPESTDLRFEPSQSREMVNAWLLNSDTCDGVVDWDAVLRDPTVPQTYNPFYFSDSIHANALGHQAMANATPISRWFSF